MRLAALGSFVTVAHFVLAKDTTCLALAHGYTRCFIALRPGVFAEQETRADICCFLFTVTHLPHFFVAVVSEIQVVCCYDFIASVVIIIWICGEQENIVIDIQRL